MNYELALKLKEAGFSQKETNPFYPIGYGVIHSPTHYGDILMGQRIVIPTLEELIEACGDNIKEVKNLSDMNLWVAYSSDSFDMTGEGITPHEAISNLWLALKKKVS